MRSFLTVTTPPGNLQLVSSEAVVSAIGDMSADPTVVEDLIDRVSGIITDYLGRTLGSQSVTETFRLTYRNDYWAYNRPPVGDANPLILTQTPVTTLTSLTENGVTLTAGTHFELEYETGLAWRLDGYGHRARWLGSIIVATYTGGYNLPTATPAVIQDAALQMIRAAYVAQGKDTSVISERVENVGQINWSPNRSSAGSITADLKAALAPYRATPIIF